MENKNIKNIFKDEALDFENRRERFTRAFVESIHLSEKSKQKEAFHLQTNRQNL